ncbi:MAG: hypothetical protein ACTIAA_02945 [Microbacterium sp.]
MSTSDQPGDRPLTRKQLREIRLTGATPVIGEDEAAAAAKQENQAPAAPPVRPAEPSEEPPAPVAESTAVESRLTRRQVREQERLRTAAVPVAEPIVEPTAEPVTEESDAVEETVTESAQTDEPQPEPQTDEPQAEEAEPEELAEVVSGVPSFAPVSAQSQPEVQAEAEPDVETDAEPEPEIATEAEADAAAEEGDEDADADAAITGERPIVNPALGTQLLGRQSEVPAFTPSFDELITTDSGGSHRAPNTLIFTHPGEGSLSGPVASTGEMLITGSYELPKGLGSQGHAHGTADGKDIDSVLIDGELPPSSSPTPIAASSAVSTIKPAGEVIRPPAPEKGNKLMMILAITAGGLALALAVALVVAFTTNVFG